MYSTVCLNCIAELPTYNKPSLITTIFFFIARNLTRIIMRMKATSAKFRATKPGHTDRIIDHSGAIVPLISEDREKSELFFIGTAFYISQTGILLTAKHNLFNRQGEQFNNLGVFHLLPDQKFILRPVLKVAYNSEYDIAYLLPSAIFVDETTILGSDAVVLSDTIPELGDQLGTYAYPNSIMKDAVGEVNPTFYLGDCTEFHPNGFGLLKNPCIQTTIHIKSGASGGPVFDKNGRVFAVCSTGFDLVEGEEPISFVTPIFPTFNFLLEDDSGRTTVAELINQGVINLKRSGEE